MRFLFVAAALVVLFLNGCTTLTTSATSSDPAPTPAMTIVTPDQVLAGKVARVNEAGRFVVLEFPVSHLPTVGQTLFVYRAGLKVAEVKITGPQRDDHTVADLTTGETQPGDEVRDH